MEAARQVCPKCKSAIRIGQTRCPGCLRPVAPAGKGDSTGTQWDGWGLLKSLAAAAGLYGAVILAAAWESGAGGLGLMVIAALVVGALLRSWWWPPVIALPVLAFGVLIVGVASVSNDPYAVFAFVGGIVVAGLAILLAGAAAFGVAVGQSLKG